MSQTLSMRVLGEQAQDVAMLLEASAQGDRAAFAKLYALTSARLFSLALRIVRRRDIAEDILQDSYVTIWRKAAQRRGATHSAFGWMATVVRHRAIDHMRSTAAKHDSAVDIAMLPESLLAIDQASEVELLVDHRVEDCFQTLEEAHSEAIRLAFYFGMTHGEIADKLCSPIGTVKSWVRRGLLKLKECMDQ